MCATAIVAKRANLEGAAGVGFDIDLPVFSVGKVQHLSQDEGINLNGVMRILELEEENRQLRHEVQELTGVTGFSVFTADMNGSITQTSRSHRARYWRGQLHAEVHALPAGESSSAQSKSMVLWHTAKH